MSALARSGVAVAAAGVLLLLLAPSAFACTAWVPLREAVDRAAIIVEADVIFEDFRDPGQGSAYDLRVRRVIKGDVGATLRVGYDRPAATNECEAGVTFAFGDHVIAIFAAPETAYAAMTHVWTFDYNGTAFWSPYKEDRGWTVDDVAERIAAQLPDTATASNASDKATTAASLSAVVVGSLAATSAFVWLGRRRARMAQSHARPRGD